MMSRKFISIFILSTLISSTICVASTSKTICRDVLLRQEFLSQRVSPPPSNLAERANQRSLTPQPLKPKIKSTRPTITNYDPGSEAMSVRERTFRTILKDRLKNILYQAHFETDYVLIFVRTELDYHNTLPILNDLQKEQSMEFSLLRERAIFNHKEENQDVAAWMPTGLEVSITPTIQDINEWLVKALPTVSVQIVDLSFHGPTVIVKSETDYEQVVEALKPLEAKLKYDIPLILDLLM